ncbi:hypothetical protein FNH22_03835 [Fulvivirga sp. M361]|uniref:hypothetical protein n=1 Tax=Fulvivirga sp. M361 TaxID=2594266 RepID=UPI001179AC94|nr:hypothetical protein [Fulvivirga sp. M361]TRX61196.1 hypothetical protein FNH22_03835 [Fulvivirga sp. M361]
MKVNRGQKWGFVSFLNDLAVSEDYKGVSGKYFDNDKGTFGKAHQDAYDEIKLNQLVLLTDQILSR